ncbi:dnaJ homolog subfamily B member 13 [Condylostylus longicornis]|uniref:dnaJ homolog subfamily B member 13 n=1 Tax=Condylostylus longicornis TaxID=2530218 RepID=UPI00244E4314|nr:dnaJ homolog subfamily B member 13 [Condylostylus longicornis]
MPELKEKNYYEETNPSQEYDFYEILNVARDATKEAITLAYRSRAIECHPHRDEEMISALLPSDGNCEKRKFPHIPYCIQWILINRAYDILSHPLRREIYDRYGTYGLYNGVPLPNGYFQPYNYHGDCFKTYDEVFGSETPYANIIDAIFKPPLLYATENGVCLKCKDDPIEKNIFLDLKEIYMGTIKRMKILRYELCNKDKSKVEKKEKILIVPISPGTFTNTRIVFKEEGDQFPEKIPADIIFIVTERPDNKFTREESDLHMSYDVDLKQALCGFQLALETIDCRKLNILISDVIHPGYVKEIIGEGLPKLGMKFEKGNLYIHFNGML